MATSGISASLPDLLDSESPMMLDIPDAAAVILDILSREARCWKSLRAIQQLAAANEIALDNKLLTIKCKGWDKFCHSNENISLLLLGCVTS